MRPFISRRRTGFTLIELMVVVSVIGLLASVAYPEFRQMQLRAKRAERTAVAAIIADAVADYYNTAGTNVATISTSYNPPVNTSCPWAGGRNCRWSTTMAGWNKLAISFDTPLYYHYTFHDWMSGSARCFDLHIYGDIDVDGVLSRYDQTYCFRNGVVDVYNPSEGPDNGTDDW